ncbi:hypothetical protein GUJ93_ZPchr0009g1409 [Zizania palustris]|uniref:Uncharacterized protein n=1 Tax=Zizania palustris TaxID=103762 RepID=A0A8J5RM90_ZIZPA|nr:hypothetical protein GUJ93_ZPchr0009g1409 [Zizania palustris]
MFFCPLPATRLPASPPPCLASQPPPLGRGLRTSPPSARRPPPRLQPTSMPPCLTLCLPPRLPVVASTSPCAFPPHPLSSARLPDSQPSLHLPVPLHLAFCPPTSALCPLPASLCLPNAEVLNKSVALHMNINAAKGLQDDLKTIMI